MGLIRHQEDEGENDEVWRMICPYLRDPDDDVLRAVENVSATQSSGANWFYWTLLVTVPGSA